MAMICGCKPGEALNRTRLEGPHLGVCVSILALLGMASGLLGEGLWASALTVPLSMFATATWQR